MMHEEVRLLPGPSVVSFSSTVLWWNHLAAAFLKVAARVSNKILLYIRVLFFVWFLFYVNCIKWNLIEFSYIAISRFQHTCLYIRVHFFCMIFVLRNLHKMESDRIFVHCNFKVTAYVFFINDVDVLKYNIWLSTAIITDFSEILI